MTYDRLFAFAVFADHLNFTRAARELHLSQPALHVQIRKLAEEVGRPLYRRDGRALTLTPEGRLLAAHAREVQERGRAVLEEVRGEPATGPVILAAGQGAFLYLLGPAIRRFPKARWPLRLLARTGPEVLAAVREARATLGVLATNDPPADLTAERLRSVGQHVVLPSAHRLASRRTLRPADLAGEPIVVAPSGSPHRTMLAQLFRETRHELDIAVEATGWELMLQFARCGVGIAVVNDFCPAPAGTVAIPLAGAPKTTYQLVSRPGFAGRGSAALRELILATSR